MIIVTESRYLDGTGDVPKDVEYVKATDYTVQIGDNKGDLIIYHKDIPSKNVTPGSVTFIEEPVYTVLAYYRNGSYSKVTLK